MRMCAWIEKDRKRTTQSIKVLVEAIEKYWEMGSKRRRADSDEDDVEWIPKKAGKRRR